MPRQGTCPSGNQGFPVPIRSFQNATSITQGPNDIQLQFAPVTRQSAFDAKNGLFIFTDSANTFFMGGTQYTALCGQLSRPSNTGIEPTNGRAIGELRIWGRPTDGTVRQNDFAVLVIPIVSADSWVKSGIAIIIGIYFGRDYSITSAIPESDVIRYSTCIEDTNNNNYSIDVAYWRDAIEWNSRFRLVTGPVGIPRLLGPNFASARREEIKNKQVQIDLDKALLDPTGAIYIVYADKSVDATTTLFQTRFRVMYFLKKQKVEKAIETKDFKCLAIDRERDIRDGKILIDPRTGKRMDDQVKEIQDTQNLLEQEPPPAYDAGQIQNIIATILGTIVGIALIAIVVYLLLPYFSKKTEAEIALEAAQAAQLAASPTLNFMDLLIPFGGGMLVLCTVTIIAVSFIVNRA